MFIIVSLKSLLFIDGITTIHSHKGNLVAAESHVRKRASSPTPKLVAKYKLGTVINVAVQQRLIRDVIMEFNTLSAHMCITHRFV